MPHPSKIECCFFFILIILFTHSVYGQNIHYSNLQEKLFVHNPSVITQTKNISFQLTYRNQWPGSSTYNTFDAAIFIHSEPIKSSAGVFIYRDIQGSSIINHTGFGLIYGYRGQIAANWQLSAGIAGSYNIYETNFSRLNFENGQFPSLQLDENLKYFDFSAGIELSYGENAKYGISVSRLGSIPYALDFLPSVQINVSYLGKYLLSASYNSKTSIQPLVFASFQHNSNEILYGGSIDISGFIGGLYTRQNIQFEFDALIILLGIRYDNLSFYYSYDINLPGSNSRFTNLAAHEVTFLYDMQYKRKRSGRKAIKCPKF